jgi:acyl-CoA hydrolase
MAITIKSAGLSLSTSMVTAYTCPPGKTAIVVGRVANIDGAADADVTVQWLDASASNAAFKLAHAVTVAKKDAAIVFTQHLEAGDAIQAQASAVGDLDLSLNITENG